MSAQDIDGYKLTYEYATTDAGIPNRISKISESDGTKMGSELTLEYAHNQTKFTDHNGNVQIVQFNNMGNTVSVQDDQGRAQYARYAINDPTKPDEATTAAAATEESETAKGNQLRIASKLQNTVGNVLADSSFENGSSWTTLSNLVTGSITTETAYMGNKSLKMTRETGGAFTGLRSGLINIPAGETYTFSGYVKTVGGSSCLVICDNDRKFEYSEYLPPNTDWTRLEVTYTNTTNNTMGVSVRVETSEAGTTYLDCVQMEKSTTASRYNIIQNGDFRTTASWSPISGRTTTSLAQIENVPAAQLDSNIYKMTGNPQGTNRISQTVYVSGNGGDTFVFAGWAKADSVPLIDNRKFSLIATFKNGNATVNTATVDFNYCADSTINWQYAASPIIADDAYDSIVVTIAYDYNANTAYFDGVQLYKEEFGNSYTYDEKGNITSVQDLQGKTTTYVFDENNNLVEEILPSGAKLTYKYDAYHNVTEAKSSTGVVYVFTYDAFGNNESVAIKNGTQLIRSSAAYTEDKNRLLSTTDAAGNTTRYNYDENTNVLQSVQYPNDTSGSITTYDEYDDVFRLESVYAWVYANGIQTGKLSTDYVYENDLLNSITTGSTEYSFNYTDFALRSNIKIGSRTLASYIYKGINDTESRFAAQKFDDAPIQSLIGLDYGNGDKVQYTYDKQGRITTQEYLNDGAITGTVAYSYDNNGNLAKTTNSATNGWDIYYYDFTDRLVKTSSKHNGSAYSVEYGYNSDNNLATLREGFPGYTRETSYTYDKDNRITKMYVYGDSTFYAYDSYGRVSTCTTTGHSPTLKETYNYRMVGSNQTSQVETLSVTATGYSNSFEYSYDANGNIASVKNGGKTTTYTYDSANQLIREANQAAGKIWEWTYDNGGNITSRRERNYTTNAVLDTVNYTYDNTWKDLLKTYDGKNISSDTIGNMLSDGTWTYTWENGRQLASMTSGSTTWNYKYNTDGLRVQRQQGSATYKYFYTGGKLTQMSTPTSILRFTYDSSGKPLTIVVDGTPYYYVTNLQGDVVAILSKTGEKIAEYAYDAWGRLISQEPAANSIGNMNPLRYRGYIYDTETGFYYLQSRYYDPKVGRFLNADAFVSTGQGILGNNMFAYCLNNPIYSADYSGKSTIAKIAPAYADFDAFSAGSGAASGDLLIGSLVGLTAIAVSYAVSEIYTFANTFVDSLVSKYADQQPRVHHVIPVGKFQRYGPDVVQMMDDMHELLASVGISINDPENLLIISHGTHKSMHTRTYITVIHRIMMCARGGNEFDVRLALLFARMYAASLDQYPYGW